MTSNRQSLLTLRTLIAVAALITLCSCYTLLPIAEDISFTAKYEALAGLAKGSNLYIRYNREGTSEDLEFISRSILGASRDIYYKEADVVDHYSPLNATHCFHARDAIECTEWVDHGTVTLNDKEVNKWRRNCTDVEDTTKPPQEGSAAWYEAYVDPVDGIVMFKLPSKYAPSGTEFHRLNVTTGSEIFLPTPCVALSKGSIESTKPAELPFIFPELQFGCPLPCNAFYSPAASPHPNAVCSDAGIWEISDLGSTTTVGPIKSAVKITGTLPAGTTFEIEPGCGLVETTGSPDRVKITGTLLDLAKATGSSDLPFLPLMSPGGTSQVEETCAATIEVTHKCRYCMASKPEAIGVTVDCSASPAACGAVGSGCDGIVPPSPTPAPGPGPAPGPNPPNGNLDGATLTLASPLLVLAALILCLA